MIIFLYLFFSSFLHAQEDSSHHLKEVEVKSIKSNYAAQSITPVQILQHSEIQNINGNNIADAARYFSGVQIKDYGGIGGLKTISVRSLGANHTGVSYNGIFLNDAQNGQIDLGKFSLDNVEQIALYNAQPANLLQTARAFSYASVLELKTIIPEFNDREKIKLKASFNTGSFGLINPSITMQNKINNKLTSSLNTDWQKANGEYDFTYLNGSVTEKGRRTNANINAFHAAYNLRYHVNDSNVVNVDAYYYHSQRGLPGAIILNGGKGTQRYWDDNFFAQAIWRKKLSPKSEFLINGKYNYVYNHYLDTSSFYPNGKDEDIFRQNEFYVSAVYCYRPFSFAQLAYASDLFYNNFFGKDSSFTKQIGEPARLTILNNISAKLFFDRIEIEGNLLSTSIQNYSDKSYNVRSYQAFAPTVALVYQPIENIPLRIRAFYKNIFRIPTFNDLYYSEVPNTTLKPEYAKQYNIGLTWMQNLVNTFLQNISLTADGYYNHVKDMIVARPGTNIGRWSMHNDGSVDIKGIDVNAKLSFLPIGKLSYSLNANYTFQKALNMDKTYEQTYKNQIPYMPKNFGSFNIQANYLSFSFAYNAVFSGYRYALDQNLYSNLLQAWHTQDVLFSYKIQSSKYSSWRIVFELNNLFNKQYQIVWYYPMPGRNSKIGLYWNI
ncbi:MAG: TonB-dependent receptor [Arachidicoccus sp.]|nr:TonB-dependent receptor [Arachidicoccus sp.]